MKDFDSMAGYVIDECPVHRAPQTGEYDFGMQDATVVKWACGCAACYIGDALDDNGTYHTSFPSAAGRARLGALA